MEDDSYQGYVEEESDDEQYKFENPQGFLEQAWNLSGSTPKALQTFLRHVREELDERKFLEECNTSMENNIIYGGKLWDVLLEEAGDDFDAQVSFVEEVQQKVNLRLDVIRAARFPKPPHYREDSSSDSTENKQDENSELGKTQPTALTSAETPANGAAAAGEAQGGNGGAERGPLC